MISCIIFDWKRTLYDPDTKTLIYEAKDLLDFIKNQKISMILIGKGGKDMQEEIDRLNVGGYFKEIIFAEGQKDPQVFKKYISADSKKTIFIGDRVRSELEIGHKLGATTIWVKQGKFATEEQENKDQQPDYTVSSLDECLRQLQMDQEIERLLQDLRRQVKKISPQLLPLVDKFIESCQGGKRLRGKLVVLGYELASEKRKVKSEKLEEVLKVAAAYEIMHAAILAHDDIIDQSPIRRGRPSLYKSVGTEQAITLADLGFFLAIKIIAESKFPEKLKNQALKIFAQTMAETAIGQMLDIQKGDPATVRKLKTARYTVAGPLVLGAILGGAKLYRGDLVEFGENLGIAFQIRDDILDGEAPERDLANAVKYVSKAKSLIPKLTEVAKMRKTLHELADYMIKRTK